MKEFNVTDISVLLDSFSLTSLRDDRTDLTVLEFIAQRLYTTLHGLKRANNVKLPFILNVEERERHAHRIVIYQSQPFFTNDDLLFVSFVGKKQHRLERPILHDIAAADQALVSELSNNAHLLSYSSLELRDGNWCNLVVFSSTEAKRFFEMSPTHQHAAQQLAARYYEWIRIHNGLISNGSMYSKLSLLKTKYYTFPR
ncbi:MAG: hypothetical protein JOZ18_11210, partial [Chloroflexi bacterium]|nr:hypothetical protein [Chloroflexota bacterium]